jgi:PKD repeat protein
MLPNWSFHTNIQLYSEISITDYQIKFIIHRTTGTSSGDNIYVGQNCASDYSDIRFTSELDEVYSHYIESSNSTSATIWVKVPNIPLGYSTIVLQYGNSNATSTSSAEDTFIFYDDFQSNILDTSKWTDTSTGGTISVSSGYLTISGNLGAKKGIVSTTSFGKNCILETSIIGSASSPDGEHLSFGYGWADIEITYDSPHKIVIRDRSSSDNILYTQIFNGSNQSSDDLDILDTTEKQVIIQRHSNNIITTTYGNVSSTSSIALTDNLPICIGTYRDLNTLSYTFGPIKIRKFAYIEPIKYYPQPLINWTYKGKHYITSSTELTNYQVKILVNYGAGESSNDTVYLDGKCKADFGDIRFTDSNNNEIPYWIESINETLATFWVKIPSISNNTIINIYYGNETASTTSNGNTTFEFFDDFNASEINTTKWTYYAGVSSSSSICTITRGSSASYIYGNTNFGTGYGLRFKVKYDVPNPAGVLWSGLESTNKTTNSKLMDTIDKTNCNIGSGSLYGSFAHNVDMTTYHTVEIIRTGGIQNTTIFNIDDVQKASSTTYASTTNRHPIFHAYVGTNTNIYIDFVAIRKYTSDTLIHGRWLTGIEDPLKIITIPTIGTTPLSVKFNISIKDPLYNFILDFGDKNTYTGDDVTTFSTTHVYTAPGTYHIWAEGYNEFATHVYYEIPYGVTINAKAVVASFSVDQTANHITFTDTSSGNVDEWFWTFGDGNHSYEQNPIHTYWSPATYTVTLYTSNQYQYDTYTTTVTVTQILTPPEVYFTPNNLNVISPALPYTVNFTNLSTPAFGCTYNWLIDGTTYTTENPSHSFATYGMYDVGLTVTNALGSATKTYNDAIRITRKGKTFYEVINYADTPATFHVEVFNEVATSADTIIQAHIFDESINFVQDEIPDEPGLDEWGMRHFYSSINEWGHRIISAVTDWGNRILYNGSTLDNSPVTLFKAQEFREDVVFIDEWQFGTT